MAESNSFDDRVALAFGRQVMRSLLLEGQVEDLQRQVAGLREELARLDEAAENPRRQAARGSGRTGG